jgi:hypothetical protein
MTGTIRRSLTALAVAVAFSAAPPTSSADDAADAPAPPTLRLAAGTTYVYRYVQDATMRVRSKELHLPGVAFAAGDDGSEGARLNLRLEWTVGLTLVEVRPDESIVVSLLPLRATGVASFGDGTPPPPGARVEPMPAVKFDSDDVDRPSPSPFVGRAIVVRLAPNARVLEAKPTPLAPPRPGAPARVEPISRAAAVEFAQRFFQELPTAPPRPKTAWESRRALAPEMGSLQVVRIELGDVVETATVAKCDALVLSATIHGKPTPATPDSDAAVESALSKLRSKVLEAESTGDVAVLRATGLARSRTTHVAVKAHRDEIHLAGGTFVDSGLIPHAIEVPKTIPAQDETYEIVTRLELVGAK